MEQLTFELAVPASPTFANFLAGPNVEAVAATALLKRVLGAPEVPEANAGLVEFQREAMDGAPDAIEMIRQADEAMYHAKTNGLPLHVEACRSVIRPGGSLAA